MTSKFNAYLGSLSLAAVVMTSPVAAQMAPASWSGPYVGAFGGYGGGQSSQHDNGFVYKPPGVVVPPGGGGENGPPDRNQDGQYGLHGAVGGGLIGYNYQFNQVVIGLEGDIAASSIKGASGFCGTPQHLCGTSIGTAADVRGRVGYAFGSLLPFIAGGLAIDRIQAYDTLFGASGAGFQTGYTIGGGLDYRITPTIALRVEYLHSEFGSREVFQIVPGVPERIATRTDVVRAGITFGFYDLLTPAPVVARY